MYRIVSAIILCSLALGMQADDLRDPTQPLGHRTVSSGAPALELNSILISDDRKLAVINGQQLRENETISGAAGTVVRRIDPSSVLVQQGEKSWRLRLNNQSIRR